MKFLGNTFSYIMNLYSLFFTLKGVKGNEI
nr:MAG TPA: hypothetical protein [Caudoviricetes sp.]